MGRLYTWDYTRPYYYMVTLKRLPGLPPLSRLSADDPWGFDRTYPITRALSQAITDFVAVSPGVQGVKPFIIMPDHLHLLVKIAEVEGRRALPYYVNVMKGRMRQAFRGLTRLKTPLFDHEWHDHIVKRSKQLPNFIHYILENPQMAILRQQAKSLFHCQRDQRHYRLGERAFDCVGNLELLNEPALVAVKVSRRVRAGSNEWNQLLSFYGRWRPDMVAVGTWWSEGEKMVARLILERGGALIYLVPDGFGLRWHPAGDAAQRVCAEGRVLYLSPYPPHTAQLPIGETRRRCLELNSLAAAMAESVARSRSEHMRDGT